MVERKELKNQKVTKDSKFKEWLVDYVGNELNPKNEEVTVDMIVEVAAKEFPEFLLVVAEENYIRGYEQALDDIHEKKKNGTANNKNS